MTKEMEAREKTVNRFADAALILIDIQQGFDDPAWGARNNPDAEANAARLLAAWRAAGRRVFHVRHASRNPASPLSPSGPGFAFKDVVAPRPGEPEFVKQVNSGFIGTGLEAQLRAANVDAIIIFGLTTPHCVSTTTRMAGNLGFTTFVAADACADFASNTCRGWREGATIEVDPELSHRIALAHLHGEFATVLDTNDILKEATNDVSDRIPALPRPHAA
jgi:nicotinamidase-related amidase